MADIPLIRVDYRVTLADPLPISLRLIQYFFEKWSGEYPELLDSDGVEAPPGGSFILWNTFGPAGAIFASPKSGLSVKVQFDMLKLSWALQNAKGPDYPRFDAMQKILLGLVDDIGSDLGSPLKVRAANLGYTKIIQGDATTGLALLKEYLADSWQVAPLATAKEMQGVDIAWRTKSDIDLRLRVSYGLVGGPFAASGYVVENVGGAIFPQDTDLKLKLVEIHAEMESTYRESTSGKATE